VKWTLPWRASAACAVAIPFTLAAGPPTGHAKNGDTHITGSGHSVVADNVVHDIIVYGSNESVFYKSGQPIVWDRGRELGMTNRISQVAG